MSAVAWPFDFLIEAALVTSVLLGLGSMAVLCCREPVRRARLILLTLGACLAAPLLHLLPGLPHWSLPLWTAPARTTHALTSPVPDARPRDLAEKMPVLDLASAAAKDDERELPGGSQSERVEPESAAVELADGEPAQGESTEFSAVETATTEGERVGRMTNPGATGLATAEAAGSVTPSAAGSIAAGVFGAYLVGVSAMILWALLGLAGLQRVLRGTCDASPSVRALLREIAGPAADRVRLLVSPRVAQPFTFAALRPVIVLPADLCRIEQGGSENQLRWCLAHEWAHLARGDVWVWSLAGLVRIVHFYQPLCWFLGSELRLCQDYLADAAAAQIASPESYAEFLTSRAIGRPVPIGLGIAGGKSELYRRVIMLVRNRESLETHCPRWWTVAIGMAALALVLTAASFGERTTVRAAAEPPILSLADEPAEKGNASTTEQDDTKPPAEKPIAETQEKQAAPGEGSEPGDLKPAEPLDDAARKKLLSRLASRASLHPQGAIQFKLGSTQSGHQRLSAEYLYASAGESWVLRPSISADRSQHTGPFVLVHDGRCFEGTQTALDANRGDASALTKTEQTAGVARIRDLTRITVRYPDSLATIREWESAYGLGTIYYPRGRTFVSDRSIDASFPGTQRLYGLEARVIEWDVAPDDAANAFPITNEFLAMGGLLRIYVAEPNDVVVRIEAIDRFGTRQFRADFWGYDGRVAGVPFPRFGRIESGVDAWTFEVTELFAEAPREEFVLDIPAGIHVVDIRPKEQDQFRGDSRPGQKGAAMRERMRNTFVANQTEYPLHQFTTSAAYPQGFPRKLLAELDRDVLPWERGQAWTYHDPSQPQFGPGGMANPFGRLATEPGASLDGSNSLSVPTHLSVPTWLAISQQWAQRSGRAPNGLPESQPVNSGPAASAGRSASRNVRKKSSVLYGGKTFDEWRMVLVNDLETKTREHALEALGTFAANGLAKEAATAIGEALDGEDRETIEAVSGAACAALARSGAAGLPLLEKLVASNNRNVRVNALAAIAKIAASTAVAVPILKKLTSDSDPGIRGTTYQTLASYYLEMPGVADGLHRALADDGAVRKSIIAGLSRSKAPAEDVAAMLGDVLHDDDATTRQAAAVAFALRAPPTAENARRFEQSVLAGSLADRGNLLQELFMRIHQGAMPVPEIVVPTLVALLGSEETHRSPQAPEPIIGLLGRVARGDSVKVALPVLIDAINLQLPTRFSGVAERLQIAAVDAVGQIGPAAKDAVPVLERWLETEIEISPQKLQDTGLGSPKQWRARFEAAIRKIEKK